jgi:hypothetical protein
MLIQPLSLTKTKNQVLRNAFETNMTPGGLKGYTPLKISKGDLSLKKFKAVFAKIWGKLQFFLEK